ncbi:uncharacterized protein LOC143358314 isoform X2 [Halictus rubicundus]|uniref:uncharacterized protein LOC143358314 isoform X2 n=1 Tax=Halictus rubicundus TaxID=77578 RepID=UPI0040364B83
MHAGTVGHNGADDRGHGGAESEPLSRHHRYQYFGAARQRDSSKVDESRVGHELEQAEERMVVGRAGGRDAAAGLLGCRCTGRLAGVARRVADLLAAKRLDPDLRDGSSRLCRRAERRSFAGRGRSAIWSGAIAGVRSTTGCASSRRRRSNVNTQSSFVARPDKRLSLRVGRVESATERSRIRTELCARCNGERMELVPCNGFPAKVQGSSKEHSFPNGKENELPCTTATATVKKCKNVALRRRVSVSSNDERRSELAGPNGRQGHAFGETFSLKKTPFHVHCDEKNVPETQQKPQPQTRSRRGSIATSRPSVFSRDLRNERKQPAPKSEDTGDGLSRKQLPDDRYRRNESVLPSKIPRRARSISTESDRRKPLSRDDGNAWSRQAISVAPSSSKAVERVMAAGQAMVDRTRWLERVDGSATVQGKGVERRIVDPIDWEAPISEVRRDDSSPTRPSVRPRKQQARTGTSKAPPNLFPGELVCNAEYHKDLFFVEREKEERAPRLSANFLAHFSEHVNAEQRTVIVTFMLHLGVRIRRSDSPIRITGAIDTDCSQTHCRYPSYIVYRAVKLFDAAIDSLPVATALIQLTALASLWIALKTLENAHKIPTASQMIRLAKDLYAGREDLLIEYERKILRALDFNVTFADAHSLLTCHLINSKRCAAISDETFAFAYKAGGYVIDLTLLDEMFCRTSASLVAVTAAELVLGLIVDTEQARATDLPAQVRPRWLFWRGLLYAASGDGAGSRFGVRFQDEEMDRCRVAMLRRVLSSGRKNSSFEVVWRKYSRSRFGRIAESFLERADMLSPLETFDP